MQDLLSKGTKKGGVAAVIHETPYLQVFLAQHCDEFALVPNFNVNAAGFGFVSLLPPFFLTPSLCPLRTGKIDLYLITSLK